MLIGRVHGLLHRCKAANAGANDGRGAIALPIAGRIPSRLSNGFVRSRDRELDESVHPLLVFGRDDALLIETALGIFRSVRHHASDLRRDVADKIIGQPADSRVAGQKPLPNEIRTTAKGGNDTGTGHDNTAHCAPSER